jgi:hypothetical protein
MVVEGTPVGICRILYNLIPDNEFIYGVFTLLCAQGYNEIFSIFYPLNPPSFSMRDSRTFRLPGPRLLIYCASLTLKVLPLPASLFSS